MTNGIYHGKFPQTSEFTLDLNGYRYAGLEPIFMFNPKPKKIEHLDGVLRMEALIFRLSNQIILGGGVDKKRYDFEFEIALKDIKNPASRKRYSEKYNNLKFCCR